MKNILVYGNCQAPALSHILSKSSLSKDYNVLFQKPVHVLSENEIDSTIENFKKADLVIHQHVSREYKIPKFSTEYLLRFIKDTTKVISFPVCYFNAYFPMLDTFEGNVSILNQVHDFIIMGGGM